VQLERPSAGTGSLTHPYGDGEERLSPDLHIRESAQIAEGKRSFMETSILKATVSLSLFLKPS